MMKRLEGSERNGRFERRLFSPLSAAGPFDLMTGALNIMDVEVAVRSPWRRQIEIQLLDRHIGDQSKCESNGSI